MNNNQSIEKDWPRVSVIVPAFNVSDYIAQALDSVFSQSFPPSQVIVINDGSPDTSALERVLRPYRGRIVYMRQENRGPGAARNTGIEAASGDLIAFLDGDDYWDADFLESQVGYLIDHPDVDLVYCDASHFVDSGEVTGSLMTVAPSEGDPTLEALLSGRCTVGTSAVVARKNALVAAGLFDESIGNYSEDFDLWLRVAHSGGRLAFQRDVLAHHRIHDASLTARPLGLARGAARVLEKAREQLALSAGQERVLTERLNTIRADLSAVEAKQALMKGEYATARVRFHEAVKYRPTFKRRIARLVVRLAPSVARRLLRLFSYRS